MVKYLSLIDLSRQAKILWPTLLILSSWLCVLILIWDHQSAILSWDEVGYANAARQGIIANATEKYSLSIKEYIRLVHSKLYNVPPDLPLEYNEAQDTWCLRHFHPPFVAYLISFAPEGYGERAIRSVQLIGALWMCAAVFILYHSLSSSPTKIGTFVVWLLAVWMSSQLFNHLSFHGWAAVWITFVALSFTQWLKEYRRLWGMVLCLNLGLLCITLETGIFVILIVTVYLSVLLLFERKSRPQADITGHINVKTLLLGGGIICLTMFILWPGSIVKISVIKIVAVYAYRIFWGQEYDRVSEAGFELLRLLLPMVVTMFYISALFNRAHRKYWRQWAPCLVVGVSYATMIAPFAISYTYILAGFGPLIGVTGLALDVSRIKIWRITSLLLICVLCTALNSIWLNRGRVIEDIRKGREDMRQLARLIDKRRVWADGGHVYQYYLPQADVINVISVSYGGDQLLVREKGVYKPLSKKDMNDSIVIIQKRRNQVLVGSAASAVAGCALIEMNSSLIYDCSNSK